MGFNLADYEPVADRIERFWTDNQDGRLSTELVYHDDKRFVVKASVWRWSSGLGADGAQIPPTATGYAEELVGSTNVNKTSALENCETSAIGRALANLGYAPKGQRPSREEMVKVASRGDTERVIDDARTLRDHEKSCPVCGSGVEDNYDFNQRRVLEGKKKVPAFKCLNKSCKSPDNNQPWISWDAAFFDDSDLLIVDRGTGEIVEPPVLRDDYGPDEAPW